MKKDDDKKSASLQISPQAWGALLLLIIVAWIIISYASLIAEIMALLFGAFLVSLALRPLAGFLTRWRIPRGVTIIVVYLLLLAGFGLLAGLTGSAIIGQLLQLQKSAPELIQEVVDQLAAVPLLADLIPSLDRLGDTLSQELRTVAGTLLNAATGAGRAAVDVILILIFAYFFTTDKQIGEKLLDTWVPEKLRGDVDTVILNATERLSRWVRAQIAIMLYFGLTFGIGLGIIGVPFAHLIAILGGLLEIVPYFGGAVSLTLAIVATLTVDPSLIIWVVLLFIAVSQIEANLLIPNLYGHAVDVHPVLVILALVLGASIGGVPGALFGVPVVVVVTAVLKEFHRPQSD